MRYALLYYALLPILFFSASIANDDSFIPKTQYAPILSSNRNTGSYNSVDYTIVSVTKKDAPEEVQALIDYAREKTHSIDFILTVERESGRRWDSVGD